MNPLFIISKVELYDKPTTFNIRPECYHIKSLDHQLPDDIKILFDKFNADRLKIEKDGITYEGKTYYKNDWQDDYKTIEDNKIMELKPKDVPKNVRIMFHDKCPFLDGIRSSITNHLYILEPGSNYNLGFVPNRDSKLSELYDEMLPYIQDIINLVGKPIKMSDIKLCNDLRFSSYYDNDNDNFTIYFSESIKGRMSVITKLFTYCKLHLTDLQGRKIIKMCRCCNAYEIE
jgi:hypothetical protein